jgi:hypothetical protein
MLAVLATSFTKLTQQSTVLPAADQAKISSALQSDAQVMSDTQLRGLLAKQPAPIQAEVLSINTQARDTALQVALLVPVVAGLVGIADAFRMTKLPDIKASHNVAALG